jgi:hypothetical protein
MKYNYIKRHILNSYKKLFFDSDLLAVLQHGPRPGGGQGGHGGPLHREHHVHRHLLSHLHRKFLLAVFQRDQSNPGWFSVFKLRYLYTTLLNQYCSIRISPTWFAFSIFLTCNKNLHQ